MCGITGVLGGRPDDLAAIGGMTDALAHRGPDDRGVFVDAGVGLALGHRRLSIVDLSPEGHQPMASAGGRYVLVYNGEVYNYRELGAELAALGHRFRGHSDTEVILAAVEAWGLDAAVRRLVGIFALALWDRAARTLHLVRDHLGVKPLYYAPAGGALVFGSELGALARHPRFDRTVDRRALALLLRRNYVPAPHTIYAGARKLPPGTVLTLRPGAPVPEAVPYWSAEAAAARGLADPLTFADDDAAVDALDALLRDAVRAQMVADVPLGAFLSGGVDSSTVVALMQAQSAKPVRTFSVGFGRADYDESAHAAAVAAHLGTRHTALHLTDDDTRAVVPLLPRLWDEPFADASQIPTYLVAQLARRSVTVALSGDGGDELFAGYNRHVWAERLWRRLRVVPRPVRQAAGRAVAALPPEAWDRAARASGALRGTAIGEAQFGRKLHKLAGVLGAPDADTLYDALASHWSRPETVVRGLPGDGGSKFAASGPARASFTERMMLRDLVTYLPDDILVKVDRASMAVGLEARVPLLDHRVAEFAWRLPLGLKLRAGVGKWVLRRVLDRYVPPPLIDRPKTGFAVPLADWLRGPLRGWAEALLAPDLLGGDGYFDPAPIRAHWAEHQTATRDWSTRLWNVLMFQAWLHEGRRADDAA